jgi:hypothetical protein
VHSTTWGERGGSAKIFAKTIDTGRLPKPLAKPFPYCADCVPVEMSISATLLICSKTAGGGSNFDHPNIDEAAVCRIYTTVQVEVLYGNSIPYEISMALNMFAPGLPIVNHEGRQCCN